MLFRSRSVQPPKETLSQRETQQSMETRPAQEEQVVQDEQTAQEEQVARISKAVENLDDDFDIYEGMRVDVLTLQNRLTFTGRVDRYRDGTMTIREARDYDLPPVVYNKEVRLRFVRNDESVVLHGKVCGSSKRIWKVDRLESKFNKEQRVYFRQRLSTNPPATCYRSSRKGGVREKEVPCEILDVSAGGLLIKCQEEYNLGDRLMVDGISIAENEENFMFACQVRRVGEKVESYRNYGCQFEAVSEKEQDRLLRAIFTAQREEIRRQRERGEDI